MITGYNTDVRHNDVVFHVQTEDKGRANPFIESLIYVGGQVVAAKRASYADLVAAGKEDRAIVALMDRQHRLMIAAIRSGKFDHKLDSVSGKRPVITGESGAVAAVAAPPESPDGVRASGASPSSAAGPPTLDQVVLEYLSAEARQEHLTLDVDLAGELGLGRRARLALRTVSSRRSQPIADAQVTVKMISTSGEPLTLAQGRTDGHGCLQLDVDVPALGQGSAALIVTASSPLGNAELKHLL